MTTTHDPLVHVVDDDAALRDSLAFMLETNAITTRLYAGAVELLDAAAGTTLEGCILTDVRMPDMNGIELVRQLRARGVTLPVVVMTGHADVPLAIEAIRAGVQNFIEKPFTDEVLLDALRQAIDSASDVAASATPAADRLVVERLETLSTRERQVLDGLIAGHANKVIAYDLGISPRTVEVYRANVMTKMQVRSLSELVRVTVLNHGA